ncbi:thioredoxin-like negative regulator of GroEL [Bacillus mesophilus]|uniref:Thioredoxin family protein n=1 Tax=Bacillus mesophilus TaxID=1808955 RepID=A0A6M0QAS6_9BACI|nr:thioredoxin family protein [Bacillus mesophilus]MBM7661467.1 thioredoxin-like negative regulator of GroEL [Bacillus mesophilus]NEY72138.1 thioredoxin family protein [Bacillus mesophilus]
MVVEEWQEIRTGDIMKHKELALFLFTPICGTCKLAEKMLTVIQELLPDFPIKKVNLNYTPELASEWEIQSVPCLLLFKHGVLIKKIFAFQSVDYLYKEIKYLCSTEE